jgi:hypothetical protein
MDWVLDGVLFMVTVVAILTAIDIVKALASRIWRMISGRDRFETSQNSDPASNNDLF